MTGPVYYDGTAEWTRTAGTDRPYRLGGAIPGARRLYGTVPTGDWGYFEISDGVRWEVAQARFRAPDVIEVIALVASSAGGAAVSWPASGRRLVRLVPQAITSAQIPATADLDFWAAVEAGTIADLGDLSETIVAAIDMGDLAGIGAGASDLALTTDLGELLSAQVDPDDAQFWVAVELGQAPDFGDFGDQVVTGVDMGDLAGIGIAASPEAALLELGEID